MCQRSPPPMATPAAGSDCNRSSAARSASSTSGQRSERIPQCRRDLPNAAPDADPRSREPAGRRVPWCAGIPASYRGLLRVVLRRYRLPGGNRRRLVGEQLPPRHVAAPHGQRTVVQRDNGLLHVKPHPLPGTVAIAVSPWTMTLIQGGDATSGHRSTWSRIFATAGACCSLMPFGMQVEQLVGEQRIEHADIAVTHSAVSAAVPGRESRLRRPGFQSCPPLTVIPTSGGTLQGAAIERRGIAECVHQAPSGCASHRSRRGGRFSTIRWWSGHSANSRGRGRARPPARLAGGEPADAVCCTSR